MSLQINDAFEKLRNNSYAIIRGLSDEDQIDEYISRLMVELSACTIQKKVLSGHGDPNPLPIHTENITEAEDNMLRYFALSYNGGGFEGGNTVIYCAENAAKLIKNRSTELAQVIIRYTSLQNPDIKGADHPLVVNLPYGEFLRYRSRVSSNQIISKLPDNFEELDLYTIVDDAIASSVLTSHRWTAGDLLIIDNKRTLHGRDPYSGFRSVTRYRFDEGRTLKDDL